MAYSVRNQNFIITKKGVIGVRTLQNFPKLAAEVKVWKTEGGAAAYIQKMEEAGVVVAGTYFVVGI